MSAATFVSLLWLLLLLMGNHAVELTTDDNMSIPDEDTSYPDIDYTATNTYLEDSIPSTTDISARTISVKDVFEDTSKEDRGITVIKNWLKGDEGKGQTTEKPVFNLTEVDLQIINEIVEDVYAEVVKKNATLLKGPGEGEGQDRNGDELNPEDVGGGVQEGEAKEEEEIEDYGSKNKVNRKEDGMADDNLGGVDQSAAKEGKEERKTTEGGTVKAASKEINGVGVQQGVTKEEETGAPANDDEKGANNGDEEGVRPEDNKVEMQQGQEEENVMHKDTKVEAETNEDKKQVEPEDNRVGVQQGTINEEGTIISQDSGVELPKSAINEENVKELDLEENRADDNNRTPQKSIPNDEGNEKSVNLEVSVEEQPKEEGGTEDTSDETKEDEQDGTIVHDANKEEGNDDVETIEEDMEINGQVNSVKILKEDDEKFLPPPPTTGHADTAVKNEESFAVQQIADPSFVFEAEETSKPNFKEEDVSTPVGDFTSLDSKVEDQDMVESSKIEDAVSNEVDLVVSQSSDDLVHEDDTSNNLEDTCNTEDPVQTAGARKFLKNEESPPETADPVATFEGSTIVGEEVLLETPNVAEVDSPVISNPRSIEDDLVANQEISEGETELVEPDNSLLMSQSIEGDLTTELSQEDESTGATEKLLLETLEESKVKESSFVDNLEKDLTESIQLLKHELYNNSSEEASTSRPITLEAELKGVTAVLKQEDLSRTTNPSHLTQDEILALENFDNSSPHKLLTDDKVSKNLRNSKQRNDEKDSSVEVDRLKDTFSDSSSISEELSAESLKVTSTLRESSSFEQPVETSSFETTGGPNFEDTEFTTETVLGAQQTNETSIFFESTTLGLVRDSLDGFRLSSDLEDKIETMKKLDNDRNAAMEYLQGFLGASSPSSSLNVYDLDETIEEVDSSFGESSEDPNRSTTVWSLLGVYSQSTYSNARGFSEGVTTSGSFFDESFGKFNGSTTSRRLQESRKNSSVNGESTTLMTLPETSYEATKTLPLNDHSENATLKTSQDLHGATFKSHASSLNGLSDDAVKFQQVLPGTSMKSTQTPSSTDNGEDATVGTTIYDESATIKSLKGLQGNDERSQDSEEFKASASLGQYESENQEPEVTHGSSNVEEGSGLGEDNDAKDGEVLGFFSDDQGSNLSEEGVMKGASQGAYGEEEGRDFDKDKDTLDEEGLDSNREEKAMNLGEDKNVMDGEKQDSHGNDEGRGYGGVKSAMDGGSQGAFIKRLNLDEGMNGLGGTKQGLQGKDAVPDLGNHKGAMDEEGQKNIGENKDPDVMGERKKGLHGKDDESDLGEDSRSLESYLNQDSLSENISEDKISTEEESQDSYSDDSGSNLGEDKDGPRKLDHLKASSTTNDSFPKELQATLYVAPSGLHQDSGELEHEKSEDVAASYSSYENYETEEQTTKEPAYNSNRSELYDSTGEESALSATNEDKGHSDEYTYEEEDELLQTGQVVVTGVSKSRLDQAGETTSSTLKGLLTEEQAKNREATRSSPEQGDASRRFPLEEAGSNGNPEQGDLHNGQFLGSTEGTTSLALVSLRTSQEKTDSNSYEQDESLNLESQDHSSLGDVEQDESSQSMDQFLESPKNSLDDAYLASREDDSESSDNNYLEGESLSEQEEDDSNSLQGRHFRITGKIRNRNEDVCMLLNLSATVQIGDVAKTVPSTSEVYGNCTLDGQHVRIVWRELDAPECNNSLYLVFNKDSVAHRLVAVEVTVYDSHRKELVRRLKENLDLTVADGDEILTSKKIIFDDSVSLELFNLAVVSPSKGILASSVKNKNLLALQIASGCTTLLIVALVFVIYVYKKVKSKARVFKVALDT